MIMPMPQINEAVWKEADSFKNLRNTEHSLLQAHSPADIMALITTEAILDGFLHLRVSEATSWSCKAATGLVIRTALGLEQIRI